MTPEVQSHAALVGGRALMGDSLAFHIMFALLGVGLPLFISLFELIGILRKDNDFYATAHRLTFAMSALFVVGAVSGMIISFQMNLLWPAFMTFAGQVIGLPFFLEGFAFSIEAIFLGIYVFSWDRFGKWTHWLCSLPLILGSTGSAFFITTANAFMNSPQGFTYENGTISNIDPIAAMFNPATPYETTHSILSYYLTTAFALAAVYSYFMLKKRVRDDSVRFAHYKKLITFLLGAALVLAVCVGIAGDESGKYLARREPLKLAAAEGVYETETHAPLNIGGIAEKDGLHGAIEVPGALSWLAFGDTNAEVKGLRAFDPATWPPLFVHYCLDLMIAIGMLLGAVPLLYFFLRWLRPQLALSRPVLWLIIVCGPLAFVAVECGWMVTEIGRQPYIIKGVMTTAQAFTTAEGVVAFAFVFPTLYMVLFALTYWILRRHYRLPPDLAKDYFVLDKGK